MFCFERVLPFLLLVIVGGGVGQAQERSNDAASQVSKASDPSAGVGDAEIRDYLSANGLLNRGLYELAAAEYRKFLSEHAGHEKAAAARYGLGVSLYRMDKCEEAVNELSPLSAQDDFAYLAEVGTIIGQCRLALKQHGEAAASFQKVAQRFPDHSLSDDAAVGAVEALYRGRLFDEASEWARRIKGQWPDSELRPRAEFFGGLAEMERKDFTAAAAHFGEVMERDAAGPFVDQATFLSGQCRERLGLGAEAIAQYERVLQRADSAHTGEALFSLAMVHYRDGRLDEAGRYLDRLLEAASAPALKGPAMLLRGRVWFDQGRFDRAVPVLERAASLAEETSALKCETAYWIGKCHYRQGGYVEAVRCLQEAMERYPECALAPELSYDLGSALIKSGDTEGAVSVLRGFLERFPEHALAADALQGLAMMQHQRRRFEESLGYCDEFSKRFSSHESAASLAFLGAENEFLAEHYEPAVERLREFIERHPKDAQIGNARIRLGLALYRLERLEEAAVMLAEGVEFAQDGGAPASAYLALGDIEFQRGEWKAVEAHLRRYLKSGAEINSADDALLKLGLSLQRQVTSGGTDGHAAGGARIAEALAVFDELLQKHPQSGHRTQATFERGQVLLVLERWSEAERAFREVVAVGGESRFAPYALDHLAAIASRRGDAVEAASLYERVTALAPEGEARAEAQLKLGRSEMAAKRFEAAAAAFERLVKEYPQGPRFREARGLLGIAWARLGRCTEALVVLDAVISDLDTAEDGDQRAAWLYEKAWCLRTLQRWDEAGVAYRAVLEAGRTDVEGHALLELAGLEMEAKRWEPARELLGRLLELGKVNSSLMNEVGEAGLYQLASCELELKQYRAAAERFEEFVEAFPKSTMAASAAYSAGEAWFQEGRLEAAAKLLARVVTEHSPDDAVFGPALLRLGECQAQAQQWSASERTNREYLDRFAESPQRFRAQFGLGWAREHQKRYGEAMSAYERVVDGHQGPTAARAMFQIGECLFAQDRYEEAVRELLKVDILFAYPEWSAAALYEAGRCFEKLNKSAEAKDHFRQVVEKHQGTRWAELASQRLSELATGTAVPGR